MEETMKRISIALGLVIVLAMLLAACGPAPTPVTIVQVQTVPVAVTVTPQPTAAPKKGGVLIAARAADATGLDPHKQTAFASFRVMELIFETLVTLDKNMNVVPSLAESWTFSTDGKVLTFKIRQNVKFHNGDPLTSADVKFSFERILDEKTAAAARSNFTGIDSITTPDAATAVFNLKSANASILAAMTTANAAIISKKLVEGGADPGKAVVGTGPFKLNKWDPDKTLLLDANKEYWMPGLPYLDGIEFRTIPDEASILAGLRAGTLHWGMINDPRVAITAGSSSSKLSIQRAPALAYHVLQLNAARPVFTNLKVRQAIACAIDRQQVLDTASLGEGEVTGPATPLYYRIDLSKTFCAAKDAAKAKQLLADSGAKDVAFTIIAAAGEPPTAVAEAQNIQSQLKAIGITTTIETLELGVYVDRWLKADFDAAVALNGGNPDPGVMFGRYWTSTGNLNKVAGYNSPDLDKLLADGLATTDPVARKAIYDQFQTKLIEAVPWVWLYVGYEYRVTQPFVMGFYPLSNGANTSLKSTWLNK